MGKIVIKPITIILIDNENGKTRVIKRIRQIFRGYKIPQDIKFNLYIWFDPNLRFDDENNPSYKQLISFLGEIKTDLIIQDTVGRVFFGEENSADSVKLFYKSIKNITKKFGCAWLLLHHTKKGGSQKKSFDLRGSGDWVGFPSNILMLNKIDSNEYLLTQEKARDCEAIEPMRFNVVDVNEGLYLKDIAFESSRVSTALESAVLDIRAWIKNNAITAFRTKDVLDSLKSLHRKTSIQSALNKLFRDKLIEKKAFGQWEVTDSEKSD